MISDGILIAIIAGGFAILTAAFQKILDISCVKHEDETGDNRTYSLPKCKRLVYSIPEEKTEDVFKKYREPPNEWGYNENLKYTKRTKDDNHLVIIPPNLINNQDTKRQGSVIWFFESTKKSSTGQWFLDVNVDLIKNPKYVKLFIRRFTKEWLHLYNNHEYISATEGRNTFESQSKIGEILEEAEITYDDNNNAVENKKKHICHYEQIGLIIYSKAQDELTPPRLRLCCDCSYSKKLIKIKSLATECGFEDELIQQINNANVNTCLIKQVYVGETSLYLC